MDISALILSLGAALCFTGGGVFMKLSNGFEKMAPASIALALFLGGAVVQTLAMKHAEMGVAYVFILGLEAVLAFAFGVFFFGESVSVPKMMGVALIIVGFALLHVNTSPPSP